MALYETESIILKSYSLSEADRIVVFLTRDHGVVRGVAKGAKRLKSRFGSTLEPFSTVQVSYFQKDQHELVNIQSVELLASRFGVASEPAFLQTFSYIAELLVVFAPPHDPNETLYRMVSACIETGGAEPAELSAIALYFELWLLRLGGYLPNWTRCRDCEREFGVGEFSSLQSGFALLCTGCQKARGTTQILPQHRDVFQNVQRLPPAEFVAYARSRVNDIADVSGVMKRIAAAAVGREIIGEKSLAVKL